MAVGGYDGMRVIYDALEATKGKGGGDALLAAMKGQIFESPRGQVLIDAQTRDIVQNIYIRKVETQGRPALQRRVRRDQGRQGSGQGEVITTVCHPGEGRDPATSVASHICGSPARLRRGRSCRC